MGQPPDIEEKARFDSKHDGELPLVIGAAKHRAVLNKKIINREKDLTA